MIIGENAKPHDLEVNRSKSRNSPTPRPGPKDDSIRLTAQLMTLEQAIAYIQDDELVGDAEVVRYSKRYLDSDERKRASRKADGRPCFGAHSKSILLARINLCSGDEPVEEIRINQAFF